MSNRTIGELLVADLDSYDADDMQKMIDYQSQRRAVEIAYSEILKDNHEKFIKTQDYLQGLMDEADESIKAIKAKDEEADKNE